MKVALPVAIAFALMMVNVRAEDVPFVGSWEAESYGGSCEDPRHTILITPSHFGEAEIKRVEKDGAWHVLTVRDSSGERSKTALLVEGDTLVVRSITEPQARTILIYFKCK